MTLEFRNVRVDLGGRPVLALRRFSLSRGKIAALVGDNGAGKSTLLHAAAGLVDLADGEIWLDGKLYHRGRAPAPRALRQKTALVLQEPLLSRRVTDAVGFGLKVRRVRRAERIPLVQKALYRLGLDGLAPRPVSELSGGERRLVAFASAAILEPGLLLLDEVTAGLDEGAVERVEGEVRRLASLGTTVIVTTHQSDHASRLAHRSIRLEAGCMASIALR